MPNLKAASDELFRRTPDEAFGTFDELKSHCEAERDGAAERWARPQELVFDYDLRVELLGEPADSRRLNDWSFSQVCRLSGVSKETINRLSPRTARQALAETLPRSDKPLQLLTTLEAVRSVHGGAYTRLWNADLLDLVGQFTNDFGPPPPSGVPLDGTDTPGTGLYCGEQDLFAFLVDPTGWAEIDGEAFAPGFFVWNSEVGRRSLGVQTFWFQAVCQNHIVWDATEVVEFSRKHTTNVREGLAEIGTILERLVAARDRRRDSFVRVVGKAMRETFGDDADDALKRLAKEGLPKGLAKRAVESASRSGRLTVFSVVDALTRLTQKSRYAGERAEADAKAGRLLALAA